MAASSSSRRRQAYSASTWRLTTPRPRPARSVSPMIASRVQSTDRHELRTAFRLLADGLRDREIEEIEVEPGFLHAIEPELVVPMSHLASRNCELNHHSFSACAGRPPESVGLGDGWVAEPGTNLTADDIAGYLDRVAAAEPYTILTSIFDEVFRVAISSASPDASGPFSRRDRGDGKLSSVRSWP